MSIPLYGAFLDLKGLPVLVVGGGGVAARKVGSLLECGASVTVVSPEFDAALVELNKADLPGTLSLVKRRYLAKDLNGKRLVFVATDNVELNEKICAAAEKKGVFTNCAAPPSAGSMVVPATVNHGAFSLAVSTGGASPSMSSYWRKRLEKIAGPEWGELAALQAEMRALAHEKISDPEARRALLLKLGKPHWAGKVRRLGVAVVRGEMLRVLNGVADG